jgi:uncharacterized membrane protein YjgN (DUF898 family)
MMSVVTLGIYSAWAKVRRLQYFYRHTRISGASFDYHGNPLAILRGRVLASCLFGGYYAASAVSPVAGLAALAMLAVLLPWLLARSLRFRLYNSSYRGLRFHFHGSTAEAYRVFLAMPVLAVVSLLTLAPLAHHRLKRFQHANAAYGQTRFAFDAPVWAFYKSYLIIGACLCVYVLTGVLILLRIFASSEPAGQEQFDLSGQSLFVGLVLVMYALGVNIFWSLMTVQIRNLVWRHTSLGPHRFISTLRVHTLLGILVTNMLAIVFTLGLFKPYAQIRLARYVIGELSLVSAGALDEFVAGSEPETTAFGEEAAELLDVDLGI